MADSKKSLLPSSLLSTSSSLLSSKATQLSSSSSLLKGASLSTSSTLNTTSLLLSGNAASKQSSSLLSSSSLFNTTLKPSSALLGGSSSTASSLLFPSQLSTKSTFLSSSSSTNSPSLLPETNSSRKRKAEPLETAASAVIDRPSGQDLVKKSASAVSADATERKYNTENIQPIAPESVPLNINLHCDVPAPKRPRMDPFSSIVARLENQSGSDDDFNVGLKSIKVRLNSSLSSTLTRVRFPCRKVCSILWPIPF